MYAAAAGRRARYAKRGGPQLGGRTTRTTRATCGAPGDRRQKYGMLAGATTTGTELGPSSLPMTAAQTAHASSESRPVCKWVAAIDTRIAKATAETAAARRPAGECRDAETDPIIEAATLTIP